MGLADIFAGFSDAAHEHQKTLLQLQYNQDRDLAEKYFQISQDETAPPEIREEATRRSLGTLTKEPGKKNPKGWDDFTFQLPPRPQPAAPTPVAPTPPPTEGAAPAEGAADAGTSQSPQVVNVTTPPPPARLNMGVRYTPAEIAANKANEAAAIYEAQKPARETAEKAKLDAAVAKIRETNRMRLTAEGLKNQQVPVFDQEGDFTSWRKMTPDELSQIQNANVTKTVAQASQAEAGAAVDREKIKVGALAKTLPTDIQTYNIYAQQMRDRGQIPETIDKYLEKIHPSNSQTKTYMVKTIDADPDSPTYGQSISMIVGNTVGATYRAQPPAAEQNRILQAARVMPVVDDALDVINKHPEIVGPIEGRIEGGKFKIGNPDPKYAQLGTILGSVAAMMPILHGFRGGSQALDHFSVIIGDPHLTADSLKQSLFAIKRLALEIQTGEAVPVDEETGEPLVKARSATGLAPTRAAAPVPGRAPGAKTPPLDLSVYERGGTATPARGGAPAPTPPR